MALEPGSKNLETGRGKSQFQLCSCASIRPRNAVRLLLSTPPATRLASGGHSLPCPASVSSSLRWSKHWNCSMHGNAFSVCKMLHRGFLLLLLHNSLSVLMTFNLFPLLFLLDSLMEQFLFSAGTF